MDINTCISRRRLLQTRGKRAIYGAAIGIAPRYSRPAWLRHLLDRLEPAGGPRGIRRHCETGRVCRSVQTAMGRSQGRLCRRRTRRLALEQLLRLDLWRLAGRRLSDLGLPQQLVADPAEQTAFNAKYGYDLAPPKTWKHLEEVGAFFRRPDKNLFGRTDLRNQGWGYTNWYARTRGWS